MFIVTPIIREYQLFSELARGGMGSVYLARRRDEGEHGRWFAIKVMHARFHTDMDARLMMLDEAHTAARVRHPHVASVVDVGSCDQGYYLVMEYVEGCSLQQLLACNPMQRPPRLIVPILLDVLSGLHAAHTLRDPSGEPYDIVHRDVSPHNVLVGVEGAAKITDFGIAKARDRYTATDLGSRKGKASFMAPEQFLGDDADLRVDIWAAGVTLFTALTGVLPFGEGYNAVTLERILHGSTPVPSTLGLCPPRCLDWIVMCALSRDQSARFPDAQAFADALRGVAQRHGLLAAPSEISAWVRTTWGMRLTELHRRAKLVRPPGPVLLRAVPKEDDDTMDLSWELPTTVRPPPMPGEIANTRIERPGELGRVSRVRSKLHASLPAPSWKLVR
jgi:serine/threonine protein kinase